MLLIYLPFFIILFGLLATIYLDVQSLQRGDYRALFLDTAIYLALVIVVWTYWGVGYLMARWFSASTVRERQHIHDLLTSAASELGLD